MESIHIPYLSDKVPLSVQVIAALLIFALGYFIYSTLAEEQPWKGIPVAALPEEGLGPKTSWLRQGRKTISRALRIYDGPFQVITGIGPKIVLPNRFADDLKSNPNLSFSGATRKDFFAHYPGFEGFRSEDKEGSRFMVELVRTKLTQSLGLITDDLIDETMVSIHDIFGEDSEWRNTFVKKNLLDIVARLSSRVFLGPDLCRNERWLEIAKDYTTNAFGAARALRATPSLIRPLMHWFLPSCVQLRKDVRDAHKLILPEVEQRKERARKALEAGQKPPKTADTIGWMYELAREKRESVDYVTLQLALSMAAIHTTSEALTRAVLDICAHPEYIKPLRDEIISVLGHEGWSKTALYKLRLLDSFLKESQRYNPSNLLSMNRQVIKPIILSDGTELPTGARVLVTNRYHDPTVYANAEEFDGYRFLRAREQPDQMNSWQHVTISPEHMGFGYGQHACPGRFFASNEIKIVLAHLLLKYDWKPAEGAEPTSWEFETNYMALPNCKVQLRRRKEEINVDLPE